MDECAVKERCVCVHCHRRQVTQTQRLRPRESATQRILYSSFTGVRVRKNGTLLGNRYLHLILSYLLPKQASKSNRPKGAYLCCVAAPRLRLRESPALPSQNLRRNCEGLQAHEIARNPGCNGPKPVVIEHSASRGLQMHSETLQALLQSSQSFPN